MLNLYWLLVVFIQRWSWQDVKIQLLITRRKHLRIIVFRFAALTSAVLPITHNCGSITHRFVFYAQIRDPCVILTHTYFQSDQQNKIGKVRNARLFAYLHSCPRCWLFKCHFRLLYFKADWSEIHFRSKLSLPFYALVFTWLKTCRFYLAYTCEEALGSKIWWKYRWGREKY